MKKTLTACLIGIALLASCTDAESSKFGGYSDEYKVELINCDGSITHSWISTGKVLSEEHTDGYYFKDKATGKLVEITGTLVITQN